MIPCNLPYEHQDKKTIGEVLQQTYYISYEQRYFQWTRDEYVLPVLNELYTKFTNDAQEWMGQIIILQLDQQQQIWDAQHRTTVCILILINIAYSMPNENLRNKILNHISKLYDEDDINHIDNQGQELLEQYGWKRVPNLRSEYLFDLKALGDLLNEKPIEKTESKIPAAYQVIAEFLREKSVDDKKEFYKYILTKLFCDIMIIRSWDFVADVFNKINNIKMPLPLVVIARNGIVRSLGYEHSPAVSNLFKWVKETATTIDYKMDNIIHLARCLHKRNWVSIESFKRSGECLVEESLEAYQDFEQTVRKIVQTIKQIRAHKNYSLVQKLTSGHEILTTYLIPIAYLYSGSELTQAIDILLAHAIRQYPVIKRKLSLNSKKYQTSFMGNGESGIISMCMARQIDWPIVCGQLKTMFTTHGLQKDQVIEEFTRFTTYGQKKDAEFYKTLLQFLWWHTDAHESRPDYSVADLEHILPQEMRSKECPEKAWIDHFGNLTLFVGPNSGSVRGNRSLKAKTFLEKLPFYEKSNIAFTRDLAQFSGSGFGIPQVKLRAAAYIKTLERVTGRILAV